MNITSGRFLLATTAVAALGLGACAMEEDVVGTAQREMQNCFDTGDGVVCAASNINQGEHELDIIEVAYDESSSESDESSSESDESSSESDESSSESDDESSSDGGDGGGEPPPPPAPEEFAAFPEAIEFFNNTVDQVVVSVAASWLDTSDVSLAITVSGINGGFHEHGFQEELVSTTPVLIIDQGVAFINVTWTTDTIPTHSPEDYTVCVQPIVANAAFGTELCQTFGPF